MGGFDKNDQMKSHYGINVSGKKWWTRVFFDYIDRAIFNSKVLYDESLHTTRKSLKVSKLICQSCLLVAFVLNESVEGPLSMLPKQSLLRGTSLLFYLRTIK